MKPFRKLYTYNIVLASSLVFSQMPGYTASAAPVATHYTAPAKQVITASAIGNLGSITLGSQFRATLVDVHIWPQEGGNILTYTLNYTNGSHKNTTLNNYFSRVATPSGTILPGNPITEDMTKKKVNPKGSERVTYYVNVGKTKSLKGLKIPMYVWDAKVKGYLRHLGTFKLPTDYSPDIAIGKSIHTTLNNKPITAYPKSLQFYELNGKKYAKVGVSLTNKGSTIFAEPGYMLYLVSASGTSFELALDRSQLNYKIQPQENKVITYMTEIPAYMNTNHMKLQFVRKDETLKLELPKISFNLPIATTPDLIVEKDIIKKIIINNNTIETQLNNAVVYEENNKGMWSFQLRLKNTGNKTVIMPNYDLTIKSSTGKFFPVRANALNGMIMNPLEEKVIAITAQIPLEVEQKQLQLQMIENVSIDTTTPSTEQPNTTMPSLPIAYYQIPYQLRLNTLSGLDYSTTNSYGTFVYNLHSVQRFPWMEEDLVVAKLRITNTQSVSLSLPELKAALQLDYDDLFASTEIFMDKQSTVLAPGKSMDIHVMTKIPYTTDFNMMKLNLYAIEEKESVPFVTLSTNSTTDVVNNITRGGSFKISHVGKNATLQEKKTVVYNNANASIASTEVLMTNDERRQSRMVRLQAYYKTANGEFYEATSNQPETAVNPGGKQLITFSAKLPKSVNTSGLTLYIGSGITGNKLTEPGQLATGFINMASLDLNISTPSTNLMQVTLHPYTLSIQSANGSIKEGSDTINIALHYHLFKDGNYDTGNFQHKLILKLTDRNGQSQEKPLDLGSDLTEGMNNMHTLFFSNDRYKTLIGGTYRLTLYDEVQGERIELGSQQYILTYERLPEIE
ncbi:hypothetical protein [Paenibacillus sp. CMAA1364]